LPSVTSQSAVVQPARAATWTPTEGLRVLLADADDHRRQTLAEALEEEDCRVLCAPDLAGLHLALAQGGWSAVVIDGRLAGSLGHMAFRALLSSAGRPAVILIAGPGETADRLIALERGADDVMTRPAGSRELLARMKAILRSRRRAAFQGGTGKPAAYLFGGYRLDVALEELIAPSGMRAGLSRSEYLLLAALLESPGKILSRQRLQKLSSAQDGPPDLAAVSRAVDLRISRLRRRFDGDDGEIIRTYRGRGYLLAAEVTVV
jgi:two-component system OmpR family response regulator